MRVTYIDAHRDAHGIEPICALLPIAPSTYWRHKARQTDSPQRSARAQRDDELKREITRVWHEQELKLCPKLCPDDLKKGPSRTNTDD